MPPQEPQATVPYGDPGIGGVSQGPAASSMPLPDLLQTMRQISAQMGGGGSPTANVPFTSQPMDVARHRVPPTMVPTDQNTQIRPYNNSLKAQREAKAQSMGNLLGNLVGTVVNAKAQQKYADEESTIKDYTNAAMQKKEAEKILKYYGNDPKNPAVQEANETLAKANRTLQGIQNDSKQWKVVERSYKNYQESTTDPTKMQEEGRAYQSGVQKAVEADAQGRNNETPAEAATSQRADKIDSGQPPSNPMQGGVPQFPTATVNVQPAHRPMIPGGPNQGIAPSPSLSRDVRMGSPDAAAMAGAAWQPRVQVPTQLQANPEYAAQQKYEQQVALAVLRNVAPTMMKEQGANYRADQKDALTRWKQEQIDITALEKVDRQGKQRLEQIQSTNARYLAVEDLKSRTTIYAIQNKNGPPGALGIAGRTQMKDLQTSIDKITGDIRTDETTVANMQKDADLAYQIGQKARGDELSGQIEEIKQRQKLNNSQLDQLTKMRNDLSAAVATLPPSAMQQPGVVGQSPYAGQATGQPISSGGEAGGPLSPKVQRWAPLINQYAQQYGVDPNLVASVMTIESGGKDATSPTGVRGPMQLTQGTAKAMGVDREDPVDNLNGGAKYLATLLQKNGGDVHKALEQYGDPNDKGYADRVMAVYNKLKGGGGGTSAGGGASTDSPGGGGAATSTPTQAPSREDPNRFIQQSATDIPAIPEAPTAGAAGPSSTELDAINKLLQKTGGQ